MKSIELVRAFFGLFIAVQYTFMRVVCVLELANVHGHECLCF